MDSNEDKNKGVLVVDLWSVCPSLCYDETIYGHYRTNRLIPLIVLRDEEYDRIETAFDEAENNAAADVKSNLTIGVNLTTCNSDLLKNLAEVKSLNLAKNSMINWSQRRTFASFNEQTPLKRLLRAVNVNAYFEHNCVCLRVKPMTYLSA